MLFKHDLLIPFNRNQTEFKLDLVDYWGDDEYVVRITDLATGEYKYATIKADDVNLEKIHEIYRKIKPLPKFQT